MSQGVLQELLRIQPGSMSEIVSKPEYAGLILRERSEEDRRRVTVSLRIRRITGSGACHILPGLVYCRRKAAAGAASLQNRAADPVSVPWRRAPEPP